MKSLATSSNLAQTFWPVKSSEPSYFGSPPDSMIHHKVESPSYKIIYRSKDRCRCKPYGVSSSKSVLTPGLLLKKYDLVRTFLQNTCQLPPKQLAVALALLRLRAYYPQVYSKASQLAEMANVSIPTVWRAVKRFEDMNLIEVVNRFLIRVEAQISNLYLLDKLLILIARYLAEHGQRFYEKWLKPYFSLPGSTFWPLFLATERARAP